MVALILRMASKRSTYILDCPDFAYNRDFVVTYYSAGKVHMVLHGPLNRIKHMKTNVVQNMKCSWVEEEILNIFKI